MKEILCRAFCESLKTKTVPCGVAVETPYANIDGDPLLLYYVKDITGKKWSIEDDGTQIPLLEANGVDLSRKTRGEALDYLLAEYGASFDKDDKVIQTKPLLEKDLGDASIKFVALLLRLQDLVLVSPKIVRNTFREDCLAAIKKTFDGVASILEAAPISDTLGAYLADCVISMPSAPPLAVYLGVTEERALQALVLKMELEKYRQTKSRVVLILEKAKDNPLRESTYALAQARLDDVLSFRGVESDAMGALEREFNRSMPIQ
jgi:Domain of unknown function DUF1828